MATIKRLTLNEYSRKHGVSISTLRRRIKAGQVDYHLSDGKYFLLDAPLDQQKSILGQQSTPMPHAPPHKKMGHRSPTEESAVVISAPAEEEAPENQLSRVAVENEGLFVTAREILAELKKAYALILQEKEEQILLLKDEVTDLKTLCRVLENENARLKQAAAEESQPPIAEWLDSLDNLG